MVFLEHVNVTVRDAEATAQVLCGLFDWQVRWQGPVLDGAGVSVHVGSDTQYLALFSPKALAGEAPDSYATLHGLNHIGLVVDDLSEAEARVKAAGYVPHKHADYAPGRRFYFDGPDGVEYELVSYG